MSRVAKRHEWDMKVMNHDLKHVKITSSEEKQSLSYLLRSGFAGGLAGAAAKTAVATHDRGASRLFFRQQR